MTEDQQITLGLKVFGAIVGLIASALAASTLRARKNAMQQRLDHLFQQGNSIGVVQVLSDENGTHKITGTIIKSGGSLRLKITRNDQELLHDAEFKGQKELEEYLENRTSMRLGDFSRR